MLACSRRLLTGVFHVLKMQIKTEICGEDFVLKTEKSFLLMLIFFASLQALEASNRREEETRKETIQSEVL